MPFDPQVHHRRSIRLKGYDHALAGAYFVILCTHEQQSLFGEMVGGEMQMNRCGQAACACWQGLCRHFPTVSLDVFVLMPNHLHGIIVIGGSAAGGDVGRGEEAGSSTRAEGDTIFPASSPRLTMPANATNPKGEEAANGASPAYQGVSAASSPLRPRGTQPGSLGAIIQTYKAESTRRINRMMGTRGNRVWQRN